jgi:hypothetical protein
MLMLVIVSNPGFVILFLGCHWRYETMRDRTHPPPVQFSHAKGEIVATAHHVPCTAAAGIHVAL